SSDRREMGGPVLRSVLKVQRGPKGLTRLRQRQTRRPELRHRIKRMRASAETICVEPKRSPRPERCLSDSVKEGIITLQVDHENRCRASAYELEHERLQVA